MFHSRENYTQKRGFKNIWKKFVAGLAAAAVLLTIAVPAAQAVPPNPAKLRKTELMTALKQNYGDKLAQSYMDTIEKYGLLDYSGNVITNAEAKIGENSYYGDELAKYLNDKNTDLTQTADIDGQTIPLSDLKRMLDIETDINRLYGDYFQISDTPLTEEQRANLESLHAQLYDSGLDVSRSLPDNTPSGVNVSNFVSMDEFVRFNIDDLRSARQQDKWRKRPVVNVRADGAATAVKIHWEIIPASASATGDGMLTGQNMSGDGVIPTGLTDGKRTTFQVPFDGVLKENDEPLENWLGIKVFYVRVTSPEGAYLEGGRNYLQTRVEAYRGNAPNPANPQVVSAEIQQGTFTTGDVVPITVHFNGVSDLGFGNYSDANLELSDGSRLEPANSYRDTTWKNRADALTFEYTVPIMPPSKIQITHLYLPKFGEVPLTQSDGVQQDFAKTTFKTNKIDTLDIAGAQITTSMIQSAGPKRGYNHVRIDIPLAAQAQKDASWRAWMGQDTDVTDPSKPVLRSLKLGAGKKDDTKIHAIKDIPVYYKDPDKPEAGLYAEFDTISQPSTKNQIEYIEFYMDPDLDTTNHANYDNPILAPTKFRTYAVKPVVPVTVEDFAFGLTSDDDQLKQDLTGDAPHYDVYQDTGSLTAKVTFNKEDFAPTFGNLPGDFELVSECVVGVQQGCDPKTVTVTPVGDHWTVSLNYAGNVALTMRARNGDFDYTGIGEPLDLKETVFLNVRPGKTSFLKFGADKAKISKGQQYTATWSSNYIENNDAQYGQGFVTTFDVDVTDTEGKSVWSKQVTGTKSNRVTNVTIPEGILNNLSKGDKPAYTLSVTSKNPGDQKEKPEDNTAVTITKDIEVNSTPATITLTQPQSLWALDSDSTATASWTMDNLDLDNGYDFELTVKDSEGKEVAHQTKDDADLVVDNENFTATGSATFPIAATNGYRELYTVQVRTRNTPKPGTSADDMATSWSSDSYVLYVYNSSALKLWINDSQAPDSVTLSNWDKASDNVAETLGTSGLRIPDMSQQQILALQRDINLKAVISINYGEYAWKELADQIEWKSSDSSVVSVNYPQASRYQNVEDGYASYAPMTKFKIAGDADGQATISANHAVLKSIADTVDVNVETLTNRLYLFQMKPGKTTTIKYQTGADYDAGNNKWQEKVTESDGAAAIYEPTGIKGTIYFRAADAQNRPTHVYTMPAQNLVSGEPDFAGQQLYPLNTIKLREISTVDLYLTKPNGDPYVGKVDIRGGVYRNGNYAQDARFNEVPSETPANTPVTLDVTAADKGHVKLTADSSQFWSKDAGQTIADGGVEAGDEIRFIFEIRTENDSYRPTLTEIVASSPTNDAVHADDNAIVLQDVKAGDKTDSGVLMPYIAMQQADFYRNGKSLGSANKQNLLDFTGKISPGKEFDEVRIETTAVWWGQKPDDPIAATLQDQFNVTPKNQTTEVTKWPFSSLAITRSVLKINKDTLNGWLSERQQRSVSMVFKNGDKQVKQQKLPFSVANLLNFSGKEVQSDEDLLNLVVTAITSGTQSGNCAQGTSSDCTSKAGALVKLGMNALGGKVDTDKLKIKLSPTADPTVFRAFFQMGFSKGGQTTNDATSILDDDGNEQGEMGLIEPGEDADISLFPGLGDLTHMAKGEEEYEGNPSAQEMFKRGTDEVTNPENNGKTTGEGTLLLTLSGYAEGEVFYDAQANGGAGKWKMRIVNGGFTAGGGYEYSWTYNAIVGGAVPITASLSLGASVDVNFNAATDWSTKSNDYLTQLRIYAYMRAFAGFGFDYSIMALKIGLFGQLNIENRLRWLNKSTGGKADFGYALDLSGEVGIEFMVKFLFISYDKVLASVKFGSKDPLVTAGKWTEIENYWKNRGKGTTGQAGWGGQRSRQASYAGTDSVTGTDFYATESTRTLESRDYLTEHRRTWNPSTAIAAPLQTMSWQQSLDAENGAPPVPDTMQTNAYPYSTPVLSDDGKVLGMISDMDSTDITKTRAVYSTLGGSGAYGKPVEFPSTTTNYSDSCDGNGCGDTQVVLAGSDGHLAAAWTRMTQKLDKYAGAPVSEEEQNELTNSSEVMASVWDAANSKWVTTAMTQNNGPDMAPAVATNAQGDVFVAWRAGYSVDGTDPTDLDGSDSIMFRELDHATGQWSDAGILYNGSHGKVKGIQAAMLSTGQAAVTFTVDTGDSTPTTKGFSEDTLPGSGYETMFVAVPAPQTITAQDGTAQPAPVEPNQLRLTNDQLLDQNPQLIVLKVNGEEKFVIGWHTTKLVDGKSTTDVQLRAVDAAGNLDTKLPESITAIPNVVAPDVKSNFRFSKGAQTLDDLSIIWSEPKASDVQTDGKAMAADADVLSAVKFLQDATTGEIGLTAPHDLAELKAASQVDSFDAYVPGGTGNTVKAVLAATTYDSKNAKVVGYTDGNKPVEVPDQQSSLLTATGEFVNTVIVSNQTVDYSVVAPKEAAPVQLTVSNLGTALASTVTLSVGGKTVTKQNLAPGQSTQLLANPVLGTDLTQPLAYSVDTEFATGETDHQQGTLDVNYPDLSITSLNVTDSSNGNRTLDLRMANRLSIPLVGSGLTAKVGFYSDADATMPINKYLASSSNWTKDDENGFTIPSDDLTLIDGAGFAKQFTFNVAQYVADQKDVNVDETEIPDDGVTVYAKVWLEESPTTRGASDPVKVREFDTSANTASVVAPNLLTTRDEEVTITSTVTYDGNNSDVQVDLQNNSLTKPREGNVIVELLDDDGTVVDTQQSYDSDSQQLVSLGAEGAKSLSFTFDKPGTQARVRFSDDILNTESELNDFSVDGIAVTASDFKAVEGNANAFTASVDTDLWPSSAVQVTALSDNVESTVKVNGTAGAPLQNRFAGAVTLGAGPATITTTVTSKTGDVKTYTLTINPPQLRGSVGINLDAATGKLTADTGNVSSGDGAFTYSWSGTGVTDSQTGTLDLTKNTGALGNTITLTVSRANGSAAGAIVGDTVVFKTAASKTCKIAVSGVDDAACAGTEDTFTVTPGYATVGQKVSVSYTLGDQGDKQNKVTFSGFTGAPEQVTTPGSDSFDYTVTKDDATDGVITIAAAFEHSSKGNFSGLWEKGAGWPDTMTATYGDKIEDLSLPSVGGGGLCWDEDCDGSKSVLVGDAGEQKHSVRFTPSDPDNWNVEKHQVKISVAQGSTPNFEWPSGLSAIIGSKLSDIDLSYLATDDGTFSWAKPLTSVGSAGTHEFDMIFTPKNKNLKSATDKVEVSVSKHYVADFSGFTSPGTVTYDGKAHGISGAPVAKDEQGKTVGPVTVRYEQMGGAPGSGSTQPPTAAGDYRVVLSTAEDAEHEPGAASRFFTIEQAPVTVTANSYAIQVGDTLPSPSVSYTGFVGKDAVAGSEPLATRAVAQLTVPDSNTIGESDITFATQAVLNTSAGANYELKKYVTGKLTITKDKPVPPAPPAAPSVEWANNDSSYEPGSDQPLEVRVDIPLSEFGDASVDGSELTAGRDYTVRSGSTILTLLPAYLDTLSVGEHTLVMQFSSQSVTMKFTIGKSSGEDSNTGSSDTGSADNSSGVPSSSGSHSGTPKTGAAGTSANWMLGLAALLFLAGAVLILRRARRIWK